MKEKSLLSYHKGMTRTPSDFICDDGELAECINLEVKNQEIVPAEMPLKLPFSMNSGEKLLCIHSVPGSERKNYIHSRWTEGHYVLGAFYVENDVRLNYSLEVHMNEIKNVVTLGNTLVVYTEFDAYYILFNGETYKYLGNVLPDINISFNLTGKYVVQADETQSYTDPNEGSPVEYVNESLLDVMKASINKFIEEKATGEEKFIYPFFVRYALVLANGERICHSAPILMLPSTTIAPQILNYTRNGEPGFIPTDFAIGAYVAELQYRVNSAYNLDDWKDVIRGVDIFISRQIYSYDQSFNGSISDFIGGMPINYFVGELTSIDSFTENGTWTPITITSGYHVYIVEALYGNLPYGVIAPIAAGRISKDKLAASIVENSSIFYRYTSLDFDRLTKSTSYTTINESNGFVVSSLSSLEQQETLTDDYMTNDTLLPEFATVYNSRLNIANVKRKLFNGYEIESMVQTTDDASGLHYVYVYVHTTSGDEVIVKNMSDIKTSFVGNFFFYPDTDAYKMVIYDSTNNRYSTYNLTPHPGLNGAYYFDSEFKGNSYTSGNPNITESNEPYDYLSNKLFTSDINNPFYFPLEGINTVGSAEIRGLSAITRPISQGQFGEYPLIAFCSDGNFALKVDEYGYYSGISPVQEDVVMDGKQITSLEDSVVVITQKGLMLTNGGHMTKMAVSMDGAAFDSSLLTDVNTTDESFSALVDAANDDLSFLGYLKGARIAFDYASNRLFIYNADKTYSYLYNFDNTTTTKLVFGNGLKIVSSVLDYPDSIIQDEEGGLYSLYNKEDVNSITERADGILITRPIKMGNALTLKSIYQLKNLKRVFSKDSVVKYSIYGSNDNVTYYKIGSRFGKPYSFYRIVIYTRILPKEALSGTIITKEERRTNKIR